MILVQDLPLCVPNVASEVTKVNRCITPQETSRRLVNLSVSRVVAVSPQMRLVEDNVSSLSLLDIYKLRCAKRQLEPDTPVTRYYERLATVQVNVFFSVLDV